MTSRDGNSDTVGRRARDKIPCSCHVQVRAHDRGASIAWSPSDFRVPITGGLMTQLRASFLCRNFIFRSTLAQPVVILLPKLLVRAQLTHYDLFNRNLKQYTFCHARFSTASLDDYNSNVTEGKCSLLLCSVAIWKIPNNLFIICTFLVTYF